MLKYEVEGFCTVSTSRVCKMMFQLLDNLVKAVWKFGNIIALEVSIYKQFNAHIKKAYRESLKSQAAHMQNAATMMKRKHKRERFAVTTKEKTILLIVTNRRASRYISKKKVV